MPNIFQQIGRTIEGKTKLGKIAHEALPFKKTRSIVGNALLGIKKASPLPETKDPAVREAITIADEELAKLTGEGDELDQVTNLQDSDQADIVRTIRKVRDVLDDGKLNNSAGELSPKTRKIIVQSFSALPLLAYLGYAITTGDFSVSGFLSILSSVFG